MRCITNRPAAVLLVAVLALSACSRAAQRPASRGPATERTQEITVYFTDRERYASATPPYEVAVRRTVAASEDPAEAMMRAFFEGPTAEERARGLEAITSGATGFRSLTIDDGIARIYLTGECDSRGATYTVAQPIRRNLLQLPQVEHIKIYDEEGTTEQPEGPSDSIPFCLEP